MHLVLFGLYVSLSPTRRLPLSFQCLLSVPVIRWHCYWLCVCSHTFLLLIIIPGKKYQYAYVTSGLWRDDVPRQIIKVSII